MTTRTPFMAFALLGIISCLSFSNKDCGGCQEEEVIAFSDLAPMTSETPPPVERICWLDADGDRYGDLLTPRIAVGECPPYYVDNHWDCDDHDPNVWVWPGPELEPDLDLNVTW